MDSVERARPWEDNLRQLDEDYKAAWGGSGSLDLYFGDPSKPLLVFVHIPKTAGTAVRNIIHTNFRDCGWEVVKIPRLSDSEHRDWYENLYASLGKRAEQLVCAASHSAQYLVHLFGRREVRAFTMLRDPVDRVLSRYYFLSNRSYSMEDLYREIDVPRKKNGRVSRKAAEFANGQSRRLLAPRYDTTRLPMTSSDGDADLWRSRLFRVVDESYLIGIQDRFAESVQLFAGEFGWGKVYEAVAKVNLDRPSLVEVPAETKELIRTHNWLDDELYRVRAREFEAAAAQPRPRKAASSFDDD